MIEWQDITYRIGKKNVLNNCSVLARDAEITVIIGKNGCGKTSLIRSVFLTWGGVSDGKILIDGTDISGIPRSRLSSSVALMPQALPAPQMTAEELVRLGRSPYAGVFGTLSEDDKKRAEAALHALGISHLKSRYLPTLSGGERQLAFFAMTLAKDAQSILLDEPASALDAQNRAELISFVRLLRARGKCVVLVMHDITEAVAVADRLYLMSGGTVSSPMTPEEFTGSDLPRKHFASVPYRIKTETGEKTVFLPVEK